VLYFKKSRENRRRIYSVDKGVWRYFQASTGYPELSFELLAIDKKDKAA
jgi:hypothetical protein